MKTPSFWYQDKGLLARLLAPLGQLYRAGGLLRRAFARDVYQPSIPLLCIGNIVAGGAGKTPTCLAIRKLLSNHRPDLRVAFVTRGYGGNAQSPVRVDPKIHTTKDVGDEALLLAKAAPCWACKDRKLALREAEKEADLIIMDDGFQNPYVRPSLSFLVIDGSVGVGNGKIIPAGPLRETLSDAYGRINAILMIGDDKQRLTAYLGKPVINAKLQPSLPAVFLNKPKVLAFAGIGRPEKFFASCKQAGLSVVRSRSFADHHIFTEKEMCELASLANQESLKLITTTKDFVRIPEAFREIVSVLDINLVFENEQQVLGLLALSTNQG